MRKMVRINLACAICLAVSIGSAHAQSRAWVADLDELNGSGVNGVAELLFEGGMLTVTLEASGLEQGKVHPQHIHGDPDRPSNASCPDISADTDGDGLISVGEGLPFYGPVLLALTPFSTTPEGTLDYMQSFDDLENVEPVDALQNRVIVVHGLTVDGAYVPSLPIACGQIRPDPRGW